MGGGGGAKRPINRIPFSNFRKNQIEVEVFENNVPKFEVVLVS